LLSDHNVSHRSRTYPTLMAAVAAEGPDFSLAR
jgi:hypothetical protein